MNNEIELLHEFFCKCAQNRYSIKSITVSNEFWDKLALQIGVANKGFYEGQFIFNAMFGPVYIIREEKYKTLEGME